MVALVLVGVGDGELGDGVVEGGGSASDVNIVPLAPGGSG